MTRELGGFVMVTGFGIPYMVLTLGMGRECIYRPDDESQLTALPQMFILCYYAAIMLPLHF